MKNADIFEIGFRTYALTGTGSDGQTGLEAANYGERLFEAVLRREYARAGIGQVAAFERAALAAMDERGVIDLLHDARAPRDARIDLIFKPSYAAAALGVWLRTAPGAGDVSWLDGPLEKLMDAAFCGGIAGHGSETGEMRVRTLLMFCRAGLRQYLDGGMARSDAFRRTMEDEMIRVRDTIVSGKPDGAFGWDRGVTHPAAKMILAAYTGAVHPVFVYGTLMRGERAHGHLKDSGFVCEARLEGFGAYELGSYPGIVPCPGASVRGEVYCVDDETLKRLDGYEGEGTLYRRQWVRVVLPGDVSADALAYVYAHPVSGSPLSGRWSGRA